MSNKEVTIVLNGYKRGHVLNEQIEALKSQSIPPKEIMLWYNMPPDGNVNYEAVEHKDVKSALCTYNFGVWGRFYFSCLAKTPLVGIFDDDMIPAPNFVKNFIDTIEKTNGLVVGVGLTYQNPIISPENCSYYNHYTRHGWVPGGHCDSPVEVDFGGHFWGYRREWISHFCRELPDPKYNICGEDIHISHMLKKYGNIKTYVPPHSLSDKSMWSNIDKGYGVDVNSMWETNQASANGTPFKGIMNEYFIEQRKAGWKLLNEK